MIVFLAADLLWATRIKAAAEDLRIPARPVRTLEMLEARLADFGPRGLVADLSVPDTALTLIGRAHREGLRVASFAPHVERDLMHAAKEAGSDRVLTRGQFDHTIAEVLRWLAEDPAGTPNPLSP